MLKQVYGEDAMSRTRCFEWHSRFKNGRTSLDDDERSGRPLTCNTPENVEKIRQIVHDDRRITIRHIADIVNMSFGEVQMIVTSILNMRRIAAKFVPRLLSHEQKEHRLQVCRDLRQRALDDPEFLSRIITADESWIYGYDPETKQQSSQWKSPQSPRPKKARQVKSGTKSMIIVFFDIRGIVHREFVPVGQTVNASFYCDVLRRLREDIRRKRPNLWAEKTWMLHDDNAPAHRALTTRQFCTRNEMTIVPHPPYSPDLAPCDFFLFPKMKIQLKGRRFDTVEEIQQESQKVLDGLQEKDFQGAFQKWQRRWDRCIAAQGNYFEGDGGQI